MGQAARFRRPRGAARRSRQLPPPEARFRPTVCGGGLRFRAGEFRAHPALGGAGLLASCSMGCPAQGCPGRGRSHEEPERKRRSRRRTTAQTRRGRSGLMGRRPRRILGRGVPSQPCEGPEARTPCLPRRSRQDPSLPFTPALPQTLKTSRPSWSPQLRVPASRAGHVRPAPRVRAPPRGRSQPAGQPLSGAAAAGASRSRLSLRFAPAPPLPSAPRALPAAPPGPPAFPAGPAGPHAQAVGSVSATPAPV